MVMPAASTGSASSSRNAVTSTDQTNSGILWSVMPGARMLKMVVMKLIAPRIDEAPARCSEKMTRSTDGPDEPLVESGSETVQPVPAPMPVQPETEAAPRRRREAGGDWQKSTLD